MVAKLRYLAQRYGSNAWLDFELPLTTDGPEYTHTGYEVMTATIKPEVGRRLADDGRPVLEKWGTWIHVETPSSRIWTGIVEHVETVGASLTVKVREWQGYLHGLDFKGRIWGVEADPADLVRELLAHVQSYPTGNLGATITGSTPRRFGTDSDDKAAAARQVRNTAKKNLDEAAKPRKAMQARIKLKSAPFDKTLKRLRKEKKPLDAAYQAVVKQQKPTRDAYTALRKERTRRTAVYDALVKQKASAAQIAAAKAQVDAMKTPIANAKAACDALNPARDAAKAPVTAKNSQISTVTAQKDVVVGPLKDQLEVLKEAEEPKKAAYDAAQSALQAAEEQARKDGGAYKVLASDQPDCWAALLNLARATPFEFITRTARTHGAPALTLDIRYPGVGRERGDLVFESGRNIVNTPEVVDPDEYASEVTAVGAGQGKSIMDEELNLEVTVTETDPRMRRTALYVDPAVTSKRTLTALARAELRRQRVRVWVPEIVVQDSPNCPIGAWSAGDIITVRLSNVPHRGRVTVKHRIRSWQRVGTSRARLKLEAL